MQTHHPARPWPSSRLEYQHTRACTTDGPALPIAERLCRYPRLRDHGEPNPIGIGNVIKNNPLHGSPR